MLTEGVHPDAIALNDFAPVFEAMARGLKDGEAAALHKYEATLPQGAHNYKPFITYHSTQGYCENAELIALMKLFDLLESSNCHPRPSPSVAIAAFPPFSPFCYGLYLVGTTYAIACADAQCIHSSIFGEHP